MSSVDELVDAAMHEVVLRTRAVMTERGHSFDAAVAAMGLAGGKNLLFRFLHYGEPGVTHATRLETVAHALLYCGMSWGDLERRDPATWNSVESAIAALPDLDTTARETLAAIARTAYLGMRVRAGEAA